MELHFWRDNPKAILLRGKVRRLFTVRFRPGFTQARIGTRGGECLQCAACCKILYRCPWLDGNNRCQVYHSKLRPLVCAHFPINGHDIADVTVSSGRQCGYSFGHGAMPADQGAAKLADLDEPDVDRGQSALSL